MPYKHPNTVQPVAQKLLPMKDLQIKANENRRKWPVLKLVLLVPLMLVGAWFIFIVAGGIYFFIGDTSEERVVIRGARFEASDLKAFTEIEEDPRGAKVDTEMHPVYGHRLASGEGVAIDFLSFWSDPSPDNASSFKKVTIWLPRLEEGEFILGEAGGPEAYFTDGAANIGAIGCSAAQLSGRVTVSALKEASTRISFDLKGTCVSRKWKIRKEKSVFDRGEYRFVELAKLKEWQREPGQPAKRPRIFPGHEP